MRRYLRLLIYGICCFLFAGGEALGREQCLLVPLSLEQRIGQSAVIVEGTVVSQESFWNHPHSRIYTSNIVEVYKVFKGNLEIKKIEIITEGGTVGNERQELTSTLSLTTGDAGIFICKPHNVNGSTAGMDQASFMVYGSMQGFIKYHLKEGVATDPFHTYGRIAGAREAVRQITKANYKVVSPVSKELERAEGGAVKAKTTAVPVIASFLPLVSPGGVGALLTITGVNFGAVQGSGFVEFPNANDGGATYVRPIASDYITWSDIQIIVRIPSSVVNPAGCAGSGIFRVTNSDPNTGVSPVPLTITYTWSNINDNGVAARPDLVNDNGNGGYTFQYYTAFAANTPATASFQRAMNSWCPTSVNWNVGVPTATNVAALDGINIVRFDIGAELPAGLLGRLTSYYSGCGPIGGPNTWYVNEMDVVFDDGANWQYGPALPTSTQADFESVALHELGHGIQLNHVINTLDVMHYALTIGQTRRVLNVDDLAGGSNVTAMSILPNPCGSPPMVFLPCPLSVKIVSFQGKLKDNEGAALEWVVTEQEAIEGYRVEKSMDGVRFEAMDFVEDNNAAGGTYTYNDKNFKDEAFYRLTVVEENASLWSSRTVHLRTRGAGQDVEVYPNPASDIVVFRSNNVDMAGASLIIRAADGRTARKYDFGSGNAMGEERVEMNDLAPGLYFYRLSTKTGNYSGRILKQ